MNCPVCERKLASSVFREIEGGRVYSEESYECECGYEEVIGNDGYHKVIVEGVEYVYGDLSTISGNLIAWDVWYAIQGAKEAVRDGDIHNE